MSICQMFFPHLVVVYILLAVHLFLCRSSLIRTLVYKPMPPQEKLFVPAPFFQYNKRILRQNTGGACLYMPTRMERWTLASRSFEVIPPQKYVGFSAAR